MKSSAIRKVFESGALEIRIGLYDIGTGELKVI